MRLDGPILCLPLSSLLPQRRLLPSEAAAPLRGGCSSQRRLLPSEVAAPLRGGCSPQRRLLPSEAAAALRGGCSPSPGSPFLPLCTLTDRHVHTYPRACVWLCPRDAGPL